MTNSMELKEIFDEDAQKYYSFRPHYPKELFDKLLTDTQLVPHARLLEIGPGTGQATEPLAQKGYQITAVELGEHLAKKARSVLSTYKNVEVITGAFEDVSLPDAYFDLVFSATAFHWIRPEYKFAKPYKILKPHGYLAIIHTEHVSDEHGDKFFHASHPIYQQFVPDDAPGHKNANFRLPKINSLKPPAIDNSLFELQSFTPFPYTVTHSAKDYAGLLSTYSATITMPDGKRQKFLDAIERLINTEFGGAAERHFAMTLAIAKKKEDSGESS